MFMLIFNVQLKCILRAPLFQISKYTTVKTVKECLRTQYFVLYIKKNFLRRGQPIRLEIEHSPQAPTCSAHRGFRLLSNPTLG